MKVILYVDYSAASSEAKEFLLKYGVAYEEIDVTILNLDKTNEASN